MTQGALAFVVDALRHAGGGQWFNVLERSGLGDLIQERKIISATREQFQGRKAEPLPPMLFAGIIIEGGIVGYDANTVTGGVGANYLGIGGNVKYRRDVVTIGMRAVSVLNGAVLESVTTTKTIYSVGLTASTYKFVATDALLQLEAGVTQNEPTQFAVKEAIELAVYSLVMEGTAQGLWHFQDRTAETQLYRDYEQRITSRAAAPAG